VAVWIALITGLTVTAVLLNMRFARLSNRRVAAAPAGRTARAGPVRVPGE
jgi:hypothetical protein